MSSVFLVSRHRLHVFRRLSDIFLPSGLRDTSKFTEDNPSFCRILPPMPMVFSFIWYRGGDMDLMWASRKLRRGLGWRIVFPDISFRSDFPLVFCRASSITELMYRVSISLRSPVFSSLRLGICVFSMVFCSFRLGYLPRNLSIFRPIWYPWGVRRHIS